MHEPLVSDEDFGRVQDLFAGKRRRQVPVTTVKRTRYRYLLAQASAA